ncbi:MAG: S-layer homology domain-containing protein [Thermincola sp.]|jgi:L-ascorbate metabolism protein UlaG (beta-lactamase superfamily)|nr:S-layer homology domain-containing protein [Thermincola sp.]MDT3704906.1 S-layer homology domain-containing protein [Thermincola sp.]
MFNIAKKARKAIVYAIIVAMSIMMLPTVTPAAPSSDLTGHWARTQIEDWLNRGLVKGYPDGTFRPDNNISRVEFMALVNGAFRYEEMSTISYGDVAAGAWYVDVIAKAKAAGYITGYNDGTIKPRNPITRQEAANIIMKVRKLQENPSSAEQFTDVSEISDWSKGAVGAVAAQNIMGGYPDGTFKAKNLIKRAEAVAALGKALGTNVVIPARTYDQAGVYGPAEGTEVIEGDIAVNVESVTLQNMTINGNLLLAENIGQGEVTLKNVNVKGRTLVRGGGENSIIVIDSVLGQVTVSKKDGKIRILLTGSSTVSQVVANSGVKLEAKDLKAGGFKEVVIDAAKNDKIILAGTFENVTVKAEGVKIELPKESVVKTFTLEAKVSVTGQGTVQTAEVKANGVTFETAPQNTNTSPGVTAPNVVQTPANSGGGGGGGDSQTPVTGKSSISLEYLGHASFIMTTAKQKILMDPFMPDSFIGFPAAYSIPNKGSINLITVSHQHGDHNYVAAAPGVNQIVYGVTLNEQDDMSRNFVQVTDAIYGDVSLSTVLLPHFEQDFPFGDEPNAGFIFETGGMRLVHPGDSFRGLIDGLTPDEITALKGETGIDILMLPVGNAFEGAHDSEDLINFINDLDPKVVIPIHSWNTKGRFIEAASGQGWDITARPATVSFSKDQLPETGPVIWDMEQTIDFRPLFQSAAINGSQLTLTFNEALDENSIPAADDFGVWVNSDRQVMVNGVEVEGTNVLLTLAEAVTSDDTVDLSYIVGDTALQDLTGNTANTLWGKEVENNTAVDPAPRVSSYSPADDSTDVGVNDNLVLSFDQNVTANSTKDIFIYKASDDSLFELIDAADPNKVTVTDKVVTIDPDGTFGYNTEYYILIVTGAFTNAATGDFKGIADGTVWSFATEVNQAPIATGVSISGTAKVGEVLTGNYTYTDHEGDEEGATTFQWYRKKFSFSTPEVIPGATGKTYTLTDADANKYIVFKVTPIAGTGTTDGATAASEATGKVEDVLRILIARTFDRDGNGIVDSFLIFTARNINDSKVKLDSVFIDGVAATGFSSSASDIDNNDDMFWIYFAENGHSTKAVPVLTALAGAFEAPDGESSRELTADEDVERDGAYPVVSPPFTENTTATSTDVKLTSNETGTVYYVVLPAADAVPDYDQVRNGTDGADTNAALKGNTSVTENEEATITIAGLSQGTAYKVHLVAEDASKNVTFNVITINITTP